MKNNDSPKIGLACAGGVVEGAIYEIGALCALEDSIVGLDLNQLDVYVGVSSGALIASSLANGISIKTLCRGLFGLADEVINISPEVLFKPAVKEYLYRIKRIPELLLHGLRQYLLRPEDASFISSFMNMGSILPAGLFDNDPLRAYLEKAFEKYGTDDFRLLDKVLRVVAVNLDTAEIACFGEPEYAHVPISKAVQASTALPMLYCPVEIEGEYFIDGVARRTVHASVALKEGASLLFAVNPIVPINLELARQKHGVPMRHLVSYGLPAVLSQTFRMLVYSRMRTGFRSYRHQYPDADMILVEPGVDDYTIFFSNIFSFTNRHQVCEHAFQHTRKFLRDHAPILESTLARHGMRLRMRTLLDKNRTLERVLGVPIEGKPEVVGHTEAVLEELEEILEELEWTQVSSNGQRKIVDFTQVQDQVDAC